MKTLNLIGIRVVTLSMFIGSYVFAQDAASMLVSGADEKLIELRWTHEKILKALAAIRNNNDRSYVLGDVIRAVKAANKLMNKYFNPDELDITYIHLEGDKLTLRYALGQSEISVFVDMATYAPAFFDKQSYLRAEAAINTREDIAGRMGIDIGKVHINDVAPLFHIWNTEEDTISIYSEYALTARVGNYTLVLDYTSWASPYIIIDDFDYEAGLQEAERDREKIIFRMPRIGITLRSFVDNTTGRDYVKEAQNEVLALFNPEYVNIGVGYWSMVGGVLSLSIDLDHSGYQFIKRFGSIVGVRVDLGTGQITIDPKIVDAVKRVREETAQRLNIGIGDVHVNRIYQKIVYYVITVYPPESYPIDYPPTYIVEASAGQFNLTFEYTPNIDGTQAGHLKLTSLVSRQTGVDLLQKAIENLKKYYNPAEFTLGEWAASDGDAKFSFTLKDGRIVTVKVDIAGTLRAIEERKNFYDKEGRLYYSYIIQKTYNEKGVLQERRHESKWYDRSGQLEWSSSYVATYNENGKITKREVKYLRYANGAIVDEVTHSWVYTYNEAGKLIRVEGHIQHRDGNGRLIEETRHSSTRTYDENGKLINTRSFTATYKYDDKGNLVELKTETRNYDSSWRLTSRATWVHSYVYDSNGNLTDIKKVRELYDSNGIKRISWELAGHLENGVTTQRYWLISTFDEKGNLTQERASISILNDAGGYDRYTVEYEIDSNGKITGTHVFDENGKELDWLGGEGFIHPSMIIGNIQNPPILDSELIRKDGEEIKESPKTGPIINAELQEKYDVLAEKADLQRVDGNIKIVGTLAEKENEAIALQKK